MFAKLSIFLLAGSAVAAQMVLIPGRSFAFRAASGQSGIQTPPNGPIIWYEFSAPEYLLLETNLVSAVTNRITLADAATQTGATRPEYFGSYEVTNGPIGRVRWSTSDVLEIPTNYAFSKRAASIFVVTRGKQKDRGTLWHTAISSTTWALYGWDNGQLSVWNGSQIATGLGVGHGASVQWMIGGASNAWFGSDFLAKTNGSALTAGTGNGGRIGLWTGTSFPFTDDIQSVVIYDRELSLSEKDDVLNWAHECYTTPASGGNVVLIFDGDSRTEGVISSNPQVVPDWNDYAYPFQLQLLCPTNTPRVVNLGVGGALLSSHTNAANVTRHLGWSPGTGPRIVFGLWGHNDIKSGAGTNDMRIRLDQWIASIRAYSTNAVVGHGTLPYPANFSAPELSVANWFNGYITNGASLDFTIDVASFASTTNASDYYDYVHPTVTGYGKIAAGVRDALIALGYAL